MYVGVDVGGTFTDIAINLGDGSDLILYKLSSTPEAPEVAIVEGIKTIMKNHNLDAKDITRFAHGTTVGTNALIERRCGKVALVTSEGFRDLLEIGRQTRPTVYDMHLDHPKPLVDRESRFEVPQRRLADGSIHVKLDEGALEKVALQITSQNVDCVVVCFLHSYAFPEDENRAASLLEKLLPDNVKILTSSSVFPEFREYERFSTAVLNAALITIVGAYLDRLTDLIADLGISSEIKISQSSGGLMSVRMAKEFPVRASLSGPAAGVQGALRRATVAGYENIITLDVGGTSADVALLQDGKPIEVNGRDLAGFPIRIPSLDVNSVGAGGGSIAWIDRDGLLKVGPKSAGATPGPACYDLGGADPTVTDANVMLGRLNGESLLAGRMKIKKELSLKSIHQLSSDLNVDADEAALGIVKVSCATMVKAIRSISVERGYNPGDFLLFVYGGAGALHANEVARDLGMKKIIIPPSPGILCAEGAMNAPLSTEYVSTILTRLDEIGIKKIRGSANTLNEKVNLWYEKESVPTSERKSWCTVGARYYGQNYELSLPIDLSKTNDMLVTNITSEFHKAHEANYGFASTSEPIQVVNVAIKAIGDLDVPTLPKAIISDEVKPKYFRSTLFELGSRHNTPVYKRSDLVAEQSIKGPAIVEQMDTTILIFPNDVGHVDAWGNLIISLSE
jgi:N-methylhydantoinase A